MNKPTRLTPPEGSNDGARKGSLLERAGAAFGLDLLKPARVPDKLEAGRPAPKPPVQPQNKPASAQPVVTASGSPAATVKESEPREPLVKLQGQRQEIVRSLLREQGLIDPDRGASALLEEFRIVKRQVLAAVEEGASPKSRRVLICSPLPGEGKTFCAVNLAIALAGERDREVLLVDADFAKPSVMQSFGLKAGPGFMDVLADPSRKVEELVVGTDIPGLWLLPAGARTGSDSEFLASERTAEVLDRLTLGARDRVLIFDSPPALAASPAAELAKHVGLALLVARADQTGRPALEDAANLLSACPDIRMLLNDATFSPSGRKFGSYYAYGEEQR